MDWLIVRQRVAPITAQRNLERLRFAQRRGLDLFRLHAVREIPEHAQLLLDAYLAKRLREGATIHAYNNDVKMLKHVARWLGLKAPSLHLRRENPATPRALHDHQIEILLQLYSGRRDATAKLHRALLNLELVSGLRASELASLEVQDLDTETGRLQIRHPAKGGLRRWIPLPAWAISPKRPIRAYLDWRAHVASEELRALWLTKRPGRKGSGTRMRRITPDYIRRVFGRAARIAGFPISCTRLRHTCAVRMRRAGVDAFHLKLFLGHRNLTSTEIYVEVSPEDLEREYGRRRPWPDPYARLPRRG